MSRTRCQPHIIEHPINPDSVENMNTMFQELYEDMAVAAEETPPLTFDEGDVVVGGDDGLPVGVPLGTAGQLLIAGSDLPEWTAFTIPNTVVQGSLPFASATDTLDFLPKNTSATRYLSNTGASNAPAWAQVALATGVSGTLPFANGGTGIVAVSTGDILIASGGVLARLAAANPIGGFLRSGGVLGVPSWGAIQFPNSISTGALLHATATDVVAALAAGSAGKVLTAHGAGVALTWETPAAGSVPHALLDGVTISDSVAQGVTRGSLIVGNATPKWDELVIGVGARVLRSDGTDASWAQVALATDVSGDLPLANLAQGSALSVLGVAGNAIADEASIVAASDHQVLRRIGTSIAFGAVDLSQAAAITGDLPDANLSANVPLINGTNAFTGANSFATNVLDLLIGQLKFPATQNASSNVNTLDDFERGTWTVVIGGATSESGQVYSGQAGEYVKIGRLVAATFNVALTTKGTIVGNIQIKGFPFVSGSVAQTAPIYFNALATTWVNQIVLISGSTAVGLIRGAKVAATTLATACAPADLSDTSQFVGSIIYMAAA